jgi:sarcosine oxidase delta subunit
MLRTKAGLFRVGWKKWQKQITLASIALAFAVSGVFALQKTETAAALPETTPETSETASEQGTTPVTEEPEETAEKPQDPTCYDQTGAVGWIVCPTGTTLANLIDGLYSFMSDNLLKVSPLETDEGSVIYIIWEYARNITNVVFIIFILIIVYSQLTGFGLTNYGIKKTLPRIIIAAVLVNLSYIICALAIDLSNVIGYSLIGAFNGIKESAIAAGAIPTDVASFGPGAIILALLGAGGAVLGLGLATGGSFWFLLPILLAAAIAIIVAVITMAARQALIYLLAMISPLAFVAYLLPNTEKLFTKWKDLLMKMIIFFPMMSLLFGGASLAGFAIIASAKNVFGTILGVAVQVLPLFFSFSLMKMSGTVLGKINDFARKPLAPAQAKLGTWSKNQTATSRAKHVANNRMPSAKLSNFLAKRQADREFQKAQAEGVTKNRSRSYVAKKTSATYSDNVVNRTLGRVGAPTTRLTQYALSKTIEKEAANAESDLENSRGELKKYITDNHLENTRKGRKGYEVAQRSTEATRNAEIERLRSSINATAKAKSLSGYLQTLINERATRPEEFDHMVGRAVFSDANREQAVNSILSSTIAAEDAETSRIMKETVTSLENTHTTADQLKGALHAAVLRNDTYTARAAAKLLVAKGGFGVKLVSGAMRDIADVPADAAQVNALTWATLANYLSSNADVAKSVKQGDAYLFDWGAQNGDVSNPNTTPSFSSTYITAPGNSASVWSSKYVTNAEDVFKQSSTSIKQAVHDGVLNQAWANNVLRAAKTSPNIVDYTKLYLIGQAAGIPGIVFPANPTAAEQATLNQQVQNYINSLPT